MTLGHRLIRAIMRQGETDMADTANKLLAELSGHQEIIIHQVDTKLENDVAWNVSIESIWKFPGIPRHDKTKHC